MATIHFSPAAGEPRLPAACDQVGRKHRRKSDSSQPEVGHGRLPQPSGGGHQPPSRRRGCFARDCERAGLGCSRCRVGRISIALVARSAQPPCLGTALARGRHRGASPSATPIDWASAPALKRPRERAPQHDRCRRKATACRPNGRSIVGVAAVLLSLGDEHVADGDTCPAKRGRQGHGRLCSRSHGGSRLCGATARICLVCPEW